MDLPLEPPPETEAAERAELWAAIDALLREPVAHSEEFRLWGSYL